MFDWNPDLYMKFKDERTQPARDLVNRIKVDQPYRVIDLGCGPGNSTQVLKNKWPRASIQGMDRSPAMIEKAKKDYPEIDWFVADLSDWKPDLKYDVLFSNAALQWLDNHNVLFPKIFESVSPDGAFAVQLPLNNMSSLHLIVSELTRKWEKRFQNLNWNLCYQSPEYYYDSMTPIANYLDIWTTVYYHQLDNHQGLVDWYESTGMRPQMEALLDKQSREDFKMEVLDECKKAYPVQKNGKILYPFQRLFMVAYKNSHG